MIKVLFVCHGNICRSPMAEFVMKDIVNKQGLADLFLIESAATSTEEIWNGVGNPVYPPAKEKLRQMGIGTEDNELGVGKKRARQTTREDYNKYDFIIGMDSTNIRYMERIYGGDRDKKLYKMLEFADSSDKRYGCDVADPWYTGNFDATWDDVSLGCHGLFRYILTSQKWLPLFEKEGYSTEDDNFSEADNESLRYDDFPRG